MLSIDEAIAHAREVASRKFDDRVHCISCAEEHEQLAEWLEELKAYKAIGTIEGYKNAIECYTREYTIRKSNIQYDKAIDEEVSDNMCEWKKLMVIVVYLKQVAIMFLECTGVSTSVRTVEKR